LEKDAVLGFLWVDTASYGLIFTLSPYYHLADAHYVAGPGDTPSILNEDSRAHYLGGRAMLQACEKNHSARMGVEVWAQRSNTAFRLRANPPDPGLSGIDQQETHRAQNESLFAEDEYQPASWLTLDGGVRLVHYGGLVHEDAFSPRLGAGLRVPRFGWTLHGYYAYYYQPPPLGKNFGERWSLSLNSTNVLNSRFLLDTSNTFGGTHTVNPRQIYLEARYRFHY